MNTTSQAAQTFTLEVPYSSSQTPGTRTDLEQFSFRERYGVAHAIVPG